MIFPVHSVIGFRVLGSGLWVLGSGKNNYIYLILHLLLNNPTPSFYFILSVTQAGKAGWNEVEIPIYRGTKSIHVEH